MRQLVAFLEKIHVRNTKKEYYRSALLCKLNHAEIAPLEEILGVAYTEETEFDSETDKQMEAHAKALLAQKRAMKNV
jgi:hypothetical protein